LLSRRLTNISTAASTRQKEGDLAGAIADYTNAIEINPQDADAYNNRGNVRKRQGDLVGAVKDFDAAIAAEPESPSAYVNRGVVKKVRGDIDDAIPHRKIPRLTSSVILTAPLSIGAVHSI